LTFGHDIPRRSAVSVPKRYPEEFRRKVLDLVARVRPIAQIAADLGISDQTIYGWRKQELIDTGQLPGSIVLSRPSWLRPISASVSWKPRLRSSKELVSCCGSRTTQRRYAAIATMAAEGLPI
jgi:transposase-like protein